MTSKLSPPAITGFLVALMLLLLAGEAPAQVAPLKLEAQLVWGTDDSKPPAGKDYKPVEQEIRKKLKELPLKWTNYFEVNRKLLELPAAPASRKAALSDKCEVEVKNLGGSNLEVVLIGKGKEVVKRTQALPKGEALVLGGNAPNATAWLVIVKRLE
jgi:hypothetical protein